MKLTILIPFIGTFLLFNETTANFVDWPSFLYDELGVTTLSPIPINNLYFTYFGLCFLGFGSIIYSVFCPIEISNEDSIDAYVLAAPAATSSVIAKNDFRTVLDLRFNGVRENDDADRPESPSYPHELEGDFNDLMEEMYLTVAAREEQLKSENSDVDHPEIMLGSGYLDFTELALMIKNNVRATWGVTIPYYETAINHARDISYLKYKSLDYTNFGFRFCIAFLYAIGFSLLLKPTLHVMTLLIYSFIW